MFVCWLWYHDGSGEAACKTLTGVSSTLVNHHIEWRRNKRIAGLLEGFKRKRPPVRRYKKPWSLYHARLMIDYAKLGNFYELCMTAAVMLGYGGLLRPNEYAKTKFSKLLTRGQVSFHPNNEKKEMTEVIIELTHSKTNQTGKKEIIVIPCLCRKHTKFCGSKCKRKHCPAHHILKYTKKRDSLYGCGDKLPFLIKDRNDKAVSYQNV